MSRTEIIFLEKVEKEIDYLKEKLVWSDNQIHAWIEGVLFSIHADCSDDFILELTDLSYEYSDLSKDIAKLLKEE